MWAVRVDSHKRRAISLNNGGVIVHPRRRERAQLSNSRHSWPAAANVSNTAVAKKGPTSQRPTTAPSSKASSRRNDRAGSGAAVELSSRRKPGHDARAVDLKWHSGTCALFVHFQVGDAEVRCRRSLPLGASQVLLVVLRRSVAAPASAAAWLGAWRSPLRSLERVRHRRTRLERGFPRPELAQVNRRQLHLIHAAIARAARDRWRRGHDARADGRRCSRLSVPQTARESATRRSWRFNEVADRRVRHVPGVGGYGSSGRGFLLHKVAGCSPAVSVMGAMISASTFVHCRPAYRRWWWPRAATAGCRRDTPVAAVRKEVVRQAR